jgi:hypothetical protein
MMLFPNPLPAGCAALDKTLATQQISLAGTVPALHGWCVNGCLGAMLLASGCYPGFSPWPMPLAEQVKADVVQGRAELERQALALIRARKAAGLSAGLTWLGQSFDTAHEVILSFAEGVLFRIWASLVLRPRGGLGRGSPQSHRAADTEQRAPLPDRSSVFALVVFTSLPQARLAPLRGVPDPTPYLLEARREIAFFEPDGSHPVLQHIDADSPGLTAPVPRAGVSQLTDSTQEEAGEVEQASLQGSGATSTAANTLNETQLDIIDAIRRHGRLPAKQIAAKTGLKNNSYFRDGLRAMVKNGLLTSSAHDGYDLGPRAT